MGKVLPAGEGKMGGTALHETTEGEAAYRALLSLACGALGALGFAWGSFAVLLADLGRSLHLSPGPAPPSTYRVGRVGRGRVSLAEDRRRNSPTLRSGQRYTKLYEPGTLSRYPR